MSLKKWLPFATAEDAQAWIDIVNSAKGFPDETTATYSQVIEHSGNFVVLAYPEVHDHMTQEQVESLMTHQEAVQLGYLPEPQAPGFGQ